MLERCWATANERAASARHNQNKKNHAASQFAPVGLLGAPNSGARFENFEIRILNLIRKTGRKIPEFWIRILNYS